MALTTAQRVAYLETILDNLITIVATETAYQATNGPKPSYSLDGQSVNWDTWLDGMQSKIEKQQKLIQVIGSPWRVRSRVRS